MSYSVGDKVKVFGATEKGTKDTPRASGPFCHGERATVHRLLHTPLGIEYEVDVLHSERIGIDYIEVATLVYVHEKQLELVSKAPHRVTLYRPKVVEYSNGLFGSCSDWGRDKNVEFGVIKKVHEWEETTVEL